MIARLVSGGQTGVDRAALDVARELAIPSGGWCPKGRKAEDGKIDDSYPLVESPSASYSQRTRWNVRDSDGTLVLTCGKLTGGTLLDGERLPPYRQALHGDRPGRREDRAATTVQLARDWVAAKLPQACSTWRGREPAKTRRSTNWPRRSFLGAGQNRPVGKLCRGFDSEQQSSRLHFWARNRLRASPGSTPQPFAQATNSVTSTRRLAVSQL